MRRPDELLDFLGAIRSFAVASGYLGPRAPGDLYDRISFAAMRDVVIDPVLRHSPLHPCEVSGDRHLNSFVEGKSKQLDGPLVACANCNPESLGTVGGID